MSMTIERAQELVWKHSKAAASYKQRVDALEAERKLLLNRIHQLESEAK